MHTDRISYVLRKRGEPFTVGLLVVTLFVVAVVQSLRSDLWFDESFSVLEARLPFHSLFSVRGYTMGACLR